jgi:hypothetical protein
MKKLEREALLADRAAAAEILATIPDDDVLGRLSFESRMGELDRQLEEIDKAPVETAGSVAEMNWEYDVRFRLPLWKSGIYTIYHGIRRYTVFADDEIGYRLVGGAETLLEAQLLASVDEVKTGESR